MPDTRDNWVDYRGAMALLKKRRDWVGAVREVQRTHGDYVRCRLLGSDAHLVSDPRAIEHVLYTNQHNYIFGEPAWSPLRRAIGNGLLFAEGTRYRRQRRLVQPAFQPRAVLQYAPCVLRVVRRTLEQWRRQVAAEVDMHREMILLAMVTIGHVLFDEDMSPDAHRLGALITEVLQKAMDGYLSPWSRLPWLPTPRNRRLGQLTRQFDNTLTRMMGERRARGASGRDLLSMLLRAQAHGGNGHAALSDREIRDLAAVLFGAGHETTANMLTWTWYLLACNAKARQRLHAELDDVLGGREPGADDLPCLPYTQAVLRESLRLYPTSWIIRRQAVADDCVVGRTVRAGAVVFMSPYVVHRDARWFSNPDRFDPQRFVDPPDTCRHKCAYFPFGGGERQCIGRAFAEMEGPLVIAALAQHFAPQMVADKPVTPDVTFLRPRGGMRMRLMRRSRTKNLSA